MNKRQKILFLAHLLPWPLDGGSQIKSYNTLRILAQKYDVILLALIRRPDELTDEARAALAPYCTILQPVLLRRSKIRDVIDAIMALILRESFIVRRDRRSAVYEIVLRYCCSHGIDAETIQAIHVDHLQMMTAVFDKYNDSRVKLSGTKVVLDNHNVEHLILKRLSETPGGSHLARWYAGLEWRKLREFERRACKRADLVLAVSEEDRAMLCDLDSSYGTGKFVAVPIGIDIDYWGSVKRDREAKTMLSIGTMYWPPNVDAIRWFCAEILPIIRRELPVARLVVVGPKPTAAIRAIADSDSLVTVTGLVADVRPYAASDGGVFIVPLRSGSGMRVKILTAMAMGLPIVSTTLGAEGIAVTDGIDILLADSPEAFASAVTGLLRDPERAERMGQAGKRLMELSYSWAASGAALHSAYDRMLASGAGTHP